MRSTSFVAIAGSLVLAACSSKSDTAAPVTREKVAAPAFSPPEALKFATPLDVVLATTTTGAVIRYTTDGGTPTDASPAYVDAIPITTTTTIRAIATRAGMDPSAVASVTYTYRPVLLQLDDDTHTSNAGGLEAQSMAFNRFTPAADDFPFQLRTVSVRQFSGYAGQSLRIAVFTDSDGDPSNGATLDAVYDVTVLENRTGSQAYLPWSVYELSPPVTVAGPGDVLIGYVEVGWSSYPNWPLSGGTTGRSYQAIWSSTAPSPPALPPDQALVNWGSSVVGVRGSN